MATREVDVPGPVRSRIALRREQVPIYDSLFAAILAGEILAVRRRLSDGYQDDAFRAWAEDFYDELEARVAEVVSGPVAEYGSEIALRAYDEVGARGIPSGLEDFSDAYTVSLADRWVRKSLAQLFQLARDEPEPIDPIRDRLDRWDEVRSRQVSESEATRGNGAFTKFAFGRAGHEEAVWRTAGESCPLCTSMEGRVVSVTSFFVDTGDTVRAAGDDGPVEMVASHAIGHPPLHGETWGGVCDCFVMAS